MNPSADELVQQYLRGLERELRGLPRSRRSELLEEVREHIAAALAEMKSPSAADVRTLLERMGDPAEIAAEAGSRIAHRPARAGLVEVGALVLLPLGGLLLPVVGWFAGVILLWASSAWSSRDKLIGTFLVPGGLALPVFALFMVGGETCAGVEVRDGRTGALVQANEQCSGGPSTSVEVLYFGGIIAAVVLTLGSAMYLALKLRRSSSTAQPV